MTNSEAKKLINLVKKNTFRDLVLRAFCDEMLDLLKNESVEPIIYSRKKNMVTLRVAELSLGLFHDNTLVMRKSSGESEMTMIPIYLFQKVCDLPVGVENIKSDLFCIWFDKRGGRVNNKQFYMQIAYSIACIVVGCFIFYMQFFADK